MAHFVWALGHIQATWLTEVLCGMRRDQVPLNGSDACSYHTATGFLLRSSLPVRFIQMLSLCDLNFEAGLQINSSSAASFIRKLGCTNEGKVEACLDE